jgi:hypothetical protein
MRLLTALTFLLAQPAGWKPPAVRIQDEGALKGYASTLNCVGAGISCSVGASVATVTVSGGGGGGGSPGGTNGNVQINSAGAFGAYTGTTCAYAVKSLDANGAATCTAAPTIPTPAGTASELQIRASGTTFGAYTGTGACATGSYMTALDAFGAKTCGTPTIPADVSGAHYVTTQAEAGLSAEAVLPTCTGTDKLTFNGTTISCAVDQTGAGGGGAPTTATYITQTADATLTGEQALSSLGTGLLKNTTGTGVLSIGTSGTDYAPATSGSSLLKGNGAGGFSNAVAGTDYQAPLTFPLSLANGGTNTALTAAAGAVVYSTATAHAHTAVGTAGQVLTSQGASAPTWTTPAAGGSGPAKLCGFRFASAAATSGAVTCTAAQVFYCLVNVTGYGGGDVVSFRFNGDATATNYHARWIIFSNATTPVVSSTNFTTGGNIQLGPTSITTGRSILLGCSNDATHRKICSIQEQEEATAQTTFAQMSTGYGEWFNTTAQITSIEMRTNGGQTLTAGSGFVCYGGTPP